VGARISPETRIGIVGTGAMGAHHARIAASLPGCRLSGIFDTAIDRAESVASQYQTIAYRSLAELCEHVEAVVIATPADTHAQLAGDCLQAGMHVLLEKPIAASPEEAEGLLAISRQQSRVLMIGHVERFNPAFITLQSSLDPRDLFACDFQRLSATPGRDQSVDIIYDLMVHDLDLLLALTDAPVAVQAATGHRISGRNIDHASAVLCGANGMTASLTASAVSHARVRTGRFYTRYNQFTVDFAGRRLWVHRYDEAQSPPYATEEIPVPASDPLAQEQAHFLQAIATGTPPATDADTAVKALRLAHAVQSSVNEQLLVHA